MRNRQEGVHKQEGDHSGQARGHATEVAVNQSCENPSNGYLSASRARLRESNEENCLINSGACGAATLRHGEADHTPSRVCQISPTIRTLLPGAFLQIAGGNTQKTELHHCAAAQQEASSAFPAFTDDAGRAEDKGDSCYLLKV